MVNKLGLKLWSTNTDFYYDEAIRLFQKKCFSYIELFVVPNTLDKLEKWQILKNSYNIPFSIHAPHFDAGVNLALKEKEKSNFEIYKQVKKYFSALDAKYIIVHGGIEGSVEEIIRQLKNINLQKLLIENKPYMAPTDPQFVCRGNNIEEITQIIEGLGCGFCLDIGHACCTFNKLKDSLQQKNIYEYLEAFNKLNPSCYHISDNYSYNIIDKHFHLGQGNYDLKLISKIINDNIDIAIETNKDSKTNLGDFEKDVNYLKGLYSVK